MKTPRKVHLNLTGGLFGSPIEAEIEMGEDFTRLRIFNEVRGEWAEFSGIFQGDNRVYKKRRERENQEQS